MNNITIINDIIHIILYSFYINKESPNLIVNKINEYFNKLAKKNIGYIVQIEICRLKILQSFNEFICTTKQNELEQTY